MESIEALISAINNFKGACVIVSHNEYLLNQVCTHLVYFKDANATFFLGNYQDFLDQIGWDDEEASEKKTTFKNKISKKEYRKKRAELMKEKGKVIRPHKEKVEKLESDIIACESELKSAQESLGSGEGDLQLASMKCGELEKKISKMFENMENESEKLDEVENRYALKLQSLEKEHF